MVITGTGFINGTIILNETVYYSGQLLSGNVHFELTEKLNYTGINLLYLGEATVQRTEWQLEMSGGANRSREVKYEGKEQYFNFVQCISGGVGVSSLPSGVQSIPFQFQVPFNAPSSFKGEEGMITYSITAYLEYPEPGRRDKLIKEFEVVAPINPNTLVNLLAPINLDFEEIETCNCFCQSKPIDITISLPSGAFHVGTGIPFTVKVKNDSSVDIHEMLFKITMRNTYRTQRPRSEYVTPEETLAELKKGSVLSDSQREYTWHLQLPDVVLPNLEACSIMNVTFFFKVKIRLTGCNEDVEDETEILIGVLPPNLVSEVTSPELAQKLPKAPIPIPSNPPAYSSNSNVLQTPGQNYPANTQVPQEFGRQMVTTSSNSATPQKNPYEIGFRAPTDPSYQVNNMNSGYPYPAAPPTGGYPDPSGQPAYNPNFYQPNNTASPSAPPL